MLRHACGYALANAGHDTRRIQDWLGHRSIQHTTRYTQLSAVAERSRRAALALFRTKAAHAIPD
jgi:site-specific recombinase XerD